MEEASRKAYTVHVPIVVKVILPFPPVYSSMQLFGENVI